MPTVDASKNILNAGANYAAGDWANVGAEASLDFKAQAQLLRGIDLGIGAEAGVRLEGGLHKYLSADLQGQANAAARVRAQIQMPLDLFNEAGLAIRLQAIAEAAAGVTLGIGLKAGDFIALAEQDPHMRGVPIELLKVFLHELDIQGGVMAKAAVTAMAYANLAMTGRLIKSGADLPGFTIAAEAGVGLKAGAGFRVFARFKVADPRRLIRRSIDIAVDGGIESLLTTVPEGPARVALNELRTPAKIALRAAFEVGMTLAENQGTFNAGDDAKIALRCVQVALEEAQRCVLERAVEFASNQLRSALGDLGFSNATWAATSASRQTLANRLRALPEEWFEATQGNRDYWTAVINEAAAVATALASSASIPPSAVAPLSLLWSGTQLLFLSVQRISEAQARASILGMPLAQATAPFSGSLPQPPAAIRDHINAALGRNAATSIVQADVVKFLVRAIQNGPLLHIAPEIAGVLKLVAGPNGDAAADALDVVFSNLGAFIPGADGTVSAQASLAVLRDGLRAYLDTRIEGELRPALLDAAGSNRDLQTFFDEVVISTLHTVTGPVFDTVLAWGQGDQDNQRALRELCSSLVLRLLGRSLIVVGDVLLAKAQESIQTELRQLASHVDDANGIATTLAGLTQLDRAFVAEVVEETLLVCADTFGPMPEERRAHVRALLYQIIDTAPAPDNANAVADLRNAAMVPNVEAATELAMLLGEEIVGNVIRFIQALLTRVGALVLEELQEIIVSIQEAVEEWIEGLHQLAQQLARQLANLIAEIDRLGRELEDASDALLAGASDLLGFIADHSGSRTRLREELAAFAADKAVGVLKGNDLYPGLPKEARQWARDRVREIVASLLDQHLFDPVLDAVSQIAGETADFLDDVRAIEPGDDVPVAIADLFLDRFEDAIRNIFGHDDPSFSVSITVPFVHVHIGFGVSLPLGSLVSTLRGAVRDMGRFDTQVAQLSNALIAMIAKENELVAAEDEHAALDAHRRRTDQHLAEARDPTPEVTILSPQPAAALEGDVILTMRAEGVSETYLGLAEGEQQRLFVWVNQRALPAAQLHVTALPGVGIRHGNVRAFGSPDTTAVPHPLVGLRAGGQDRDRSKRSATLSRAQGADRRTAIQAGLLGRPGGLQRRGGKTAAARPSKGDGFLPGRAFDPQRGAPAALPTRSGLTLTAHIQAEFLHDGINTIASAIVPGAAERRVEQVVSFLLTSAQQPARRGGVVMPGRPVWNKDVLHPDVQNALKQQFGSHRVALDRASKPELHALARQLWFPRRSARRAVVERTAAEIKAALPVERDRTAVIHQTIERRGFRPVIQRPPEPAGER